MMRQTLYSAVIADALDTLGYTLLNILNGSNANVLAEINKDGTGINIRSRLSGSDFQIGENGGTTATELGIRTHTLTTRLEDLNYGFGVHATTGTDFTIRLHDLTDVEIDVSSAETIGDVIDLINNHPDNQDPQTSVVAQLAVFGNGIELVDDSPILGDRLTIIKSELSQAAWDLGLVPQGVDQTLPNGPAAAAATAALSFPPPDDVNTAISITANSLGTIFNDVEIVFQDTGASIGDVARVTYDAGANQLIVDLDSTATTANTIFMQITAEGTFTAALDTSVDLTNNGTGIVGATA